MAGTWRIRRRAWIAGVAALTGCSLLPSQPLTERREWPLDARRPGGATPASRGPVLLVRVMQAGPGLTQRGLQWKQADGSVQFDFYEQWAVPPAQAVEASLRQWLAACGAFSAVIGPGSRLRADYALETELTVLLIDRQAGVARAALAAVLLDERGSSSHVLLQETVRAEAPIDGPDVPAAVRASVAAVAGVLRQVEAAVVRAVARQR
jgi:ABC-type uncharacterized transport system auxiliary subunit